MSRLLICCCLAVLWTVPSALCQINLDSLRRVVRETKSDSTRGRTLCELCVPLAQRGEMEEALRNAEEGLALVRRANDPLGQSRCLLFQGQTVFMTGDFPAARKLILESLDLAKRNGFDYWQAQAYHKLGMCSWQMGEFAEAEKQFAASRNIYRRIGSPNQEASALMGLGVTYTRTGNHVKALSHLHRASEIYDSTRNLNGMATTANSLGNFYSDIQDWEQAIFYYRKALTHYRRMGLPQGIAINLQNIGAIFIQQKKYAQAQSSIQEAYQLFEKIGNLQGQAECLQNLAMIQENNGHIEEAMKTLQKVMTMMQQTGDLGGEGMAVNAYGDMLQKLGRHQESLPYCQRGWDIANQSGDLLQKMASARSLAYAHAELGNWKLAYEFQRHLLNTRDSLSNTEKTKSIARLEMRDVVRRQDNELKLQKAEVARQTLMRQVAYGGAGVALLGSVLLLLGYRTIRRANGELSLKNDALAAERAKSERLLLNILPASVADELKNKGASRPRRYEYVSVLFADFTGFTAVSETMTPEELLLELETCFAAFDAIVFRYGLEKIKTIGDAYLVVGGLDDPTLNHVEAAVTAALEMQSFLQDYAAKRRAAGKPAWNMRVGVHVGPLVAGVVGRNKFAFDVWGDSVNTASRLETACEPGRVNVSQAVAQKLSDEFACTSRGDIAVKGKQPMPMWWVERSLSETMLSQDVNPTEGLVAWGEDQK